MSVLFESAGKLVWDPSPRVANLFQHHIRALEQMLTLRSGVGEIANDECEIDAAQLRVFLAAVAVEIDRSSNPGLLSLLGGCFAIAAGLLHACDPNQELRLEGASAALQRRGIDLVAGLERVGPIFEALPSG